MESRKKEISLTGAFCCFLVITIHLLSDAMTRLDTKTWQYAVAFIPWEFSSFAVYGFIFISALKLSMSNYPGYKGFILRRFGKIIVPYAIAVTIYWICFAIFHNYGFSLKQVVQYYFFGNIFAHFYFVIIIAQFYLLFPVWTWLIKKADAIIALPLAILVMIIFRESLRILISRTIPAYSLQYQDRFFITYLAFWLAGFYAGKHYDDFVRIIRKYTKGILIFFAAILVTDQYFNYLSMAKGVWHATLGTVKITYYFASILAVYAISLKMADTKAGSNRFLAFVYEESYYIYLYHMLALIIINEIMKAAGITSVSQTFIFRGIFVCVTTFFGCLAYRKLRQKLTGPPIPGAGKR